MSHEASGHLPHDRRHNSFVAVRVDGEASGSARRNLVAVVNVAERIATAAVPNVWEPFPVVAEISRWGAHIKDLGPRATDVVVQYVREHRGQPGTAGEDGHAG